MFHGSDMSIIERHFKILLLAIAVLTAAIYGITFYPGQGWNGDFSHYIHHAVNIVDGKDYLDTGYIVGGPSFVGPYAYPPIFPLMIAPFYAIAGLDIETFKWVGTLCLSSTVLLFPKAIPNLRKLPLLVIIILTVANPVYWTYRNNILSDLPFVLTAFLSLAVMQHTFELVEKKHVKTQHVAFWSLLLGLTTYTGYGTREIGLVLPLCVITYEIVAHRKISMVSLITLSVFMLFAFIQHKSLSGNLTPEHIQQNLKTFTEQNKLFSLTINHFDLIDLNIQNILTRIQEYRWLLEAYIPDNDNITIGIITSLVFNTGILLGAIGYIICLFKKITVLEIFCAGYVAVLLLSGAIAYYRYLMPLLPLIFYYIIVALNHIPDRYRQVKLVCIAILLGGTVTSYGYDYYNHDYSELDYGFTFPDSVEMFDFICQHTSEDDTIIFEKPRMLSLLTGRTAAFYPVGVPLVDSKKASQFFAAVSADYYVRMNLNFYARPLENTDPPSEKFSEVFRNDYFIVYRLD